MTARPKTSAIPLRYDDGFRGGILMGAAVVLVVVVVLLESLGDVGLGPVVLVSIACAASSLAFLLYLLWTHRVFASAPPAEAARIAAAQHRQPTTPLARMLGRGSTESWATSAAGIALMGSVAAAVFGAGEGGAILTLIALATAASAWAIVVYAFGLRYFRLHSAGERFDFTHHEDPRFSDFVSLALMISSAGTLAAATPSTRMGVAAVRTHTVIAFVFNALVIAITVSLLSGLIVMTGSR